uniref:Uncharacterized protein n=1 Tax=Esox lucius TaxID=8010 RepID=A0A6Q2Z6T7_ESOLU
MLGACWENVRTMSREFFLSTAFLTETQPVSLEIMGPCNYEKSNIKNPQCRQLDVRSKLNKSMLKAC